MGTDAGDDAKAIASKLLMKRMRDASEAQVAVAYSLTGRDLEMVALLVQHRPLAVMARLMGIDQRSVVSLRQTLMARLGTRRVRELIEIVRMTRLGFAPTPAEYLAARVLPALEGATIVTGIVRDRDWCGLLVRLASGQQAIAWIDSDETRNFGGWLELELVESSPAT